MAGGSQIGCYLSERDAKALSAYARSLELSRPKLLALLVVRSVRSENLARLFATFAGSEPKSGAKRVTARIDDQALKARFIKAARKLGLGSDDAAAMVFRAELAERWLDAATRIDGNRP
jgi:hypothetical protein